MGICLYLRTKVPSFTQIFDKKEKGLRPGEGEYLFDKYGHFDGNKTIVNFNVNLLDQSDNIIQTVISRGLDEATLKDRFYIVDSSLNELAEFRFQGENGFQLYSNNPFSAQLKNNGKLKFLESFNKDLFEN